jgi:ring-1,2-phenylacetyl-CoA epoxidase subunit PaaB
LNDILDNTCRGNQARTKSRDTWSYINKNELLVYHISYKFLSQKKRLKSLDPRVTRLPEMEENTQANKAYLDQLGTFEVFVQPKEGKPFQHEGAVHAPDLEMAFVLAKENFTRRFTCVSLWVAETIQVASSPTTDGTTNVYNLMATGDAVSSKQYISFEIFHLPKRGKQHVHFATVEASSAEEAMLKAKQRVPPGAVFYNVWAIRSEDIRKTSREEQDLWNTLPDKKFRDAAAYKGGEKLKEFLEKQQNKKV